MECGSYRDSFIHKTSEIKKSMFCFIVITVTRLEVLNFATWLVLRNHNIQQDTRDNRHSQYVYFVLKPCDQADLSGYKAAPLLSLPSTFRISITWRFTVNSGISQISVHASGQLFLFSRKINTHPFTSVL